MKNTSNPLVYSKPIYFFYLCHFDDTLQLLFPFPIFTFPVVPESSVRVVAPVVVIEPAPAKVRPVALAPIVSIEETPVSAPAVEAFNPPFDVILNVPVPFPIEVFDVPVVFILAVPPETVIPAEPVNKPADVIVPEPVDEIFPEVVSKPLVESDAIPVSAHPVETLNPVDELESVSSEEPIVN